MKKGTWAPRDPGWWDSSVSLGINMAHNFGFKATASVKPFFLRRSERAQRKSGEIGFMSKDMTQKLHTWQMLKSR